MCYLYNVYACQIEDLWVLFHEVKTSPTIEQTNLQIHFFCHFCPLILEHHSSAPRLFHNKHRHLIGRTNNWVKGNWQSLHFVCLSKFWIQSNLLLSFSQTVHFLQRISGSLRLLQSHVTWHGMLRRITEEVTSPTTLWSTEMQARKNQILMF